MRKMLPFGVCNFKRDETKKGKMRLCDINHPCRPFNTIPQNSLPPKQLIPDILFPNSTEISKRSENNLYPDVLLTRHLHALNLHCSKFISSPHESWKTNKKCSSNNVLFTNIQNDPCTAVKAQKLLRQKDAHSESSSPDMLHGSLPINSSNTVSYMSSLASSFSHLVLHVVAVYCYLYSHLFSHSIFHKTCNKQLHGSSHRYFSLPPWSLYLFISISIISISCVESHQLNATKLYCNGVVLMAQEAYCQSDFVMKVRVLYRFYKPYEIHYYVRIKRMYKGRNQKYRKNKTSALWFTGVFKQTLEKGETYIVSGFYRPDGLANFNDCGFVQNMTSITQLQRWGFAHYYKRHCKRCKIIRHSNEMDRSGCFVKMDEIGCRNNFSLCVYDPVYHYCHFDHIAMYQACRSRSNNNDIEE